MQQALETYAPALAKRAEANPNIRMTALMPTARFGIREEMKLAYGFQLARLCAWRDDDARYDGESRRFNDKVKVELAKIDAREQTRRSIAALRLIRRRWRRIGRCRMSWWWRRMRKAKLSAISRLVRRHPISDRPWRGTGSTGRYVRIARGAADCVDRQDHGGDWDRQ